MLENWLSYAYTYLYINRLSTKPIRPTEKLLYTIKFEWCHCWNHPSNAKLQENRPKVKFFPSTHHFSTNGWINGHYFAILAPINFYLMPLYSSHVSDSDCIWINHVTQNGCQEQVLHSLYTTTMQHARFIASCQVSPCIYKNIFYTTRNLI